MSPLTTVERVLSQTRAILLDFDGPVCSVFAGSPACDVARRLRTVLADSGAPITDAVSTETDPLAVLQWAATREPDLVRLVEDELTHAELAAVADAAPTAWSHDLVVCAHSLGRPLAIVSNNSAEAVRAYLDTHRLASYIDVVVGRPYAQPWRMKPSPEPVLAALDLLGAGDDPAVLVGDSVSDIQAAKRADVRSIGYANKPGKRTCLAAAGADAITEDPEGIRRLIHALRRCRLPPRACEG